MSDDECPGLGKCHGCLKWCSICGDVARVCDTRLRGERCDEHPVPPSVNDLRWARAEAERMIREGNRLVREGCAELSRVAHQEIDRRVYAAQLEEIERALQLATALQGMAAVEAGEPRLLKWACPAKCVPKGPGEHADSCWYGGARSRSKSADDTAHSAETRAPQSASPSRDLRPGDLWEDPSDGEVLRVRTGHDGYSDIVRYGRGGDDGVRITTRRPDPETWRRYEPGGVRIGDAWQDADHGTILRAVDAEISRVESGPWSAPWVGRGTVVWRVPDPETWRLLEREPDRSDDTSLGVDRPVYAELEGATHPMAPPLSARKAVLALGARKHELAERLVRESAALRLADVSASDIIADILPLIADALPTDAPSCAEAAQPPRPSCSCVHRGPGLAFSCGGHGEYDPACTCWCHAPESEAWRCLGQRLEENAR